MKDKSKQNERESKVKMMNQNL